MDRSTINNLPARHPIGVVILAAGGSTRYRSAKGLIDWHGKTMIRYITDIAVNSHLGPVVVITGKYHQEIANSLMGSGSLVIHNLDWEKGLSTSIHKGVQNLSIDCQGVIFLLGDQPFVSGDLLLALRNRFEESEASIIAPIVKGRPTNPILFSKTHIAELLETTGDAGGKILLKKYPVEGVVWEDDRLGIDIDTPEDYAKWVDRQ
jgi:molybdenum cofactor cytidylyltransferase